MLMVFYVVVSFCATELANSLLEKISPGCGTHPSVLSLRCTVTQAFARYACGLCARRASARVNSGRCLCVEFSTFLGTAVCGRACARLRTGFGSFALLVLARARPATSGMAALVPLRPSSGLPVRRLPAARGRCLYPPSPVSLGRLGVTRPHQFTVCYAGTEGLGT